MWFAVIVLSTLISANVRAELRDPNNSADYIILTSQEVLSNNSWIDSLLDYRAAQGRVSMAVTVEEIWAEFTPSGSDTAIREFLHFAYENWQTPQLKDVFIVGHWDVVPTCTWISMHNSMAYPSDCMFTLPINSESANSRFKIGRLPWSPRYEEAMFDIAFKIETYESSPAGDWSNSCHLIADSVWGSAQPNEIWTESIASGLQIGIAIERDYLDAVEGDPWYGDRPEILDHMNSGSLFTSYSGPSDAYWMLFNDHITASDIAALGNLYSLTIWSGAITRTLGRDSIDSVPLYFSALNAGNGGAIAAIGLADIGWYLANQRLTSQFASELFNPTTVTIGDAWYSCANFVVDSIVQGNWQNIELDNLFGTFLLGDPATIIPGRSTRADPIMAPPIPKTIEIVGSHPNPFNPSTTINFMLNRAGLASLTVYDITGRAVTTLAEQNFTAGEHSIVWNATGHASGMYLVRLESAGQFATHRVTLLK